MTADIASAPVSSGRVGVFHGTAVCEGIDLAVCMTTGVGVVSMRVLVPESVGEAVYRSPGVRVVSPARLVGFASRPRKPAEEQETDSSIRKRTNDQLMEAL